MKTGRRLSTLLLTLLLASPGLALAAIGDIPVARTGEAAPVTARWNLAVDDLSVPEDQRVLRLTLVLANAGDPVEVALCPYLSFAGDLRALQGYTYEAGDGVADCTGLYENGPSVSVSRDPLTDGLPSCPAADPTDGDLVTFDDESGELVMVYEARLAALGAGLESLPADDVRAAFLGGGGMRLEILSGFGDGITILACPAGVDAFLGAAPDAGVASSASGWYQPVVPTAPMVESATSLSSALTFGADADGSAQVELVWEDNLDPSLDGHLTHDPAPATTFALPMATFAEGLLSATFPDDLPEGFLGQATVIVTDPGTGDEIARSTHVFAHDTSAPAITAASTLRGDADSIEVAITAEDAGGAINAARLASSNDLEPAPSVLMDLAGGNFTGPTAFESAIGAVAPGDSVGAEATVTDELGNAAAAVLPVAGAGEDRTAECDSFEGAHVTLDGGLSTTAPEIDTSFTWTGAFGTADGEVVDVVLPLGQNDVDLDLLDERAFTGADDVTITVEDTTPPVINSVDLAVDCLWPPNHKYVRFILGEDVLVDAEDVCDPDLSVAIVDVQSDQPDEGRGDGNTANDVLWGSGGMCLRSERSGQGGRDRHYWVTVEAKDASGNATTEMVAVRVAHDQRHHDCPALDPSLFLEDGDAACSPEALALPEDPGGGEGETGSPEDRGQTFDQVMADCPFTNKKGKPSRKQCQSYVTAELESVYQTCPFTTKSGEPSKKRCWKWLQGRS